MKKTFVILLLVLALIPAYYAKHVSVSRQVSNLTAFARLYGYAKHFHPSDEAQDISWNRFAIYGTEQVINARNNDELQKILWDLFTPVVPTLQLCAKDKGDFDLSLLVPPDTTGYKLSCWQYEGFNNNDPESMYKSYRTNRPFKINKDAANTESMSFLNLVVPRIEPVFQKARFSFSISKPDTDTLTIQYDAVYDTLYNSDSLSTINWERKSYIFNNVNPKEQNFTIYFSNYDKVYLDSLLCEVYTNNVWHSVYYNDFSADMPGNLPAGINTDCSRYSPFNPTNNDNRVEELNGNNVLCIQVSKSAKSYTLGYMTKIFDNEIPFGELLDKPLIRGMSCRFPLSLYSNYDHTYPWADSTRLNLLKSKLEPIDLQNSTNLYARLAALINYWNQLQFFYPYWQYTKVDWEKELPKTIEKTISCKDLNSFKYIMRELKSKTLDGHAFMFSREDTYLLPGFNAEKFGKDWIVTRVDNDSLNIPPGSVVTHFNSKPMGKYLARNRKYFTFASQHKTDKMLFYMVMEAYPDSIATFTFKTPEKKVISREITFRKFISDPWYATDVKTLRYSDGVYYLNASVLSEEELTELLPELAKAKGIIFDMRIYPTIGVNLISHLLSQPDTLNFFHVRRYIYPNQALPENELNPPSGWKQIPKEPHLAAQIVFLSSAFSISYCESFLQEVKFNRLGTIIGQPTAGTTGNVNNTMLPCGIRIMWTGMFVDNPDGTRFHGVGVLPDIYVKPTVEAVVQGRDLELETALNYMKDKLKLQAIPVVLQQ